MTALLYITYIFHIVISIFLILVILLQQGKGADLAVFGGGSTQTAFGARGAVQMIHKLTVAGFCLFILTTLFIGILQVRLDTSSTVMDDSVMEAVAEDEALEGEAVATETEPEAGEAAEIAPDAEGVEDDPTTLESEAEPNSLEEGNADGTSEPEPPPGN